VSGPRCGSFFFDIRAPPRAIAILEVQIVALASDWPKIRTDPRFIELMRLARVANSLALAYPALFIPFNDQSPKARRDRFAGLLYSAALLKEGLHTAKSLGRWFRELPQYKEGFGAIFSDPAVQRLESELLDKVRDQLVFHYDRDAIATGLSRLPEGDMIVITYPPTGPATGETYFDAADDATLGYLFGEAPTDAEYLARLEGFMFAVSGLFTRYLIASHRLIAMGLVQLGCVKRNGDRPIPLPEKGV
jgi:hypothetical protein